MFGDARHSNIGGLAIHMLGIAGTAHPAIIGFGAIARGDNHLLAIVPFHFFEDADNAGFQAAKLNARMGAFKAVLAGDQSRALAGAALCIGRHAAI